MLIVPVWHNFPQVSNELRWLQIRSCLILLILLIIIVNNVLLYQKKILRKPSQEWALLIWFWNLNHKGLLTRMKKSV